MTEQPSFILRGHPSYVWRRGQERRLALLQHYVTLEGQTILDVGCGIGTWMSQFHRFTDRVFGVDIEEPRLRQATRDLAGVALAASEELPFVDGAFDVVLLHEVIEHVRNDRETILEAVRCIRPGGNVVIFAPNRMYPFETHGFYLGKRFVFRLLPLINYTPDFIRDRFCRHVRVYTRRSIKRLFAGLAVDFVVCSHVFPGFDNIAARNAALGRLVQGLSGLLERTPLRAFGISHFVVVRKRGGRPFLTSPRRGEGSSQ